MKTKILLSILLSVSILFGCQKENNQPNNGNGSSSTPTNGTLYFKNTQSDPYTIYVDGTNMGILQAGSTSTGYSVTPGISHALKAVQYSGYWFSPYTYEGTATFTSGGSVTWDF